MRYLQYLSLRRSLLGSNAKNIQTHIPNIVRNSSYAAKQKTASSIYRTMNIFDRKTKMIQRERAACNEEYHLSEYVKEEIGWRTADKIFDIKRTFKNAVELGASRGYVSRHFLPDSVEKVTLCDTSKTHLDKAIVGEGVQYEKMIMDEENFELPDDSVDLLVSSLTFHWVNDLPGLFDRIMKCLKPDGVLLACTFGGDTLMELRQALQLSDLERRGGVSPHISPFTRPTDIGGLLNAAGFTLQTVDIDKMTIWYPSAFELMRDLRLAGESNAAHNRSGHLPRDVQFAAAAIYDQMYGKDFPERGSRGVPATFEIINFVGWKPDPSQPAPIQRGSGQVSLKDLHKIDEILQKTTTIKVDDDDNK